MKYFFIILFVMTSIAVSQIEGYVDSTKIKNPKIALGLGFVPGLGQLYNEKYLKSIGFIAGELFAINRFNKFRESNSIGLRNTYAWWIFGLYLWSMLDSYVDAQLSTFPIKELQSKNVQDSLKVHVE